MTESRADRIHKSENARQRRKTVKDIVFTRTRKLYDKLRRKRRKKKK
jgi:hypothetical protein|tara:strand:+ start:283 stop:423 length:141 start_codon:yes stop_codon:yes gene_type:complete